MVPKTDNEMSSKEILDWMVDVIPGHLGNIGRDNTEQSLIITSTEGAQLKIKAYTRGNLPFLSVQLECPVDTVDWALKAK